MWHAKLLDSISLARHRRCRRCLDVCLCFGCPVDLPARRSAKARPRSHTGPAKCVLPPPFAATLERQCIHRIARGSNSFGFDKTKPSIEVNNADLAQKVLADYRPHDLVESSTCDIVHFAAPQIAKLFAKEAFVSGSDEFTPVHATRAPPRPQQVGRSCVAARKRVYYQHPKHLRIPGHIVKIDAMWCMQLQLELQSSAGIERMASSLDELIYDTGTGGWLRPSGQAEDPGFGLRPITELVEADAPRAIGIEDLEDFGQHTRLASEAELVAHSAPKFTIVDGKVH